MPRCSCRCSSARLEALAGLARWLSWSSSPGRWTAASLALQTDHNHSARGRIGLILTSKDRAGEATLSSRLGLAVTATEVHEDGDLWGLVTDRLQAGGKVDYVIADEA